MGTSSNKFKLDVCAKVSNPLGWDGDDDWQSVSDLAWYVSNPLGWDGDNCIRNLITDFIRSF